MWAEIPNVTRWIIDGVLHAAMWWQITPWDDAEMIEVVW